MASILWQNDEQTLTLIDVPRSIELAQGDDKLRHLLSSSPLQSAFPSNEPKTNAAKALLEKKSVDAELHAEYQALLQSALDTIRASYRGSWCLPRPFTEAYPRTSKKRKRIPGANVEDGMTYPELPDDMLSRFARGGDHSDFVMGSNDSEGKSSEEKTHTFSNLSDRPSSITIMDTNTKNRHGFHFHVPPHSSFYLGDVADAQVFRKAVYAEAQRSNTMAQFDCILLDPPWPNSSVQRTHKTPGSTYTTSPSMWDMRELLLDTKIELLMAENCLIGMWITNKPAVRELVLGEEGLFACWDIDLVEEWVWLKTTVHGEPVSQLDALWRKPYEVLLLGRQRRKTSTSVDEGLVAAKVKRRVLVSVPDLHSRKPCLKELLWLTTTEEKSYRALEVFARHLVAGWCSWGDECIKFNWKGYWRE